MENRDAGLLVWDHVVEQKGLRREIADPWILLTAAALATHRIRLGTAVTPVARRRPAKLAREVTNLDRLTADAWSSVPGWARPPEVSEVRELVAFLRGCRTENGLANRPFDIVVGGASPAGQAAGRDLVGPLADVGITWWDERMPWGDDLERTAPILRRIEQGPPRS